MSYNIDIDTYIGGYYGTKKVVKNILSGNKGKAVTVRVNSYGGAVDDAIDISAQFQAHGNVTVDLYAFNASAATVLTMGAKRVRAHINSLYLIHKVMSWVDEWGYMNEDDIAETIARLEKEKKDNEKITLVLARMYAQRSGKPVADILNLMKEERWITAEEAKEWGFVDEVFGSVAEGKINFAPDMEEKFNAIGLPIPQRKNEQAPEPNSIQSITDKLAQIANKLLGKANESDNQLEPNIIMNKSFTKVNALLGVEGLEFADNSTALSTEQLTSINEALTKSESEKAEALEKANKAEQELQALKDEFEAYKKSPGAKSEPVNSETDSPDSSTDADVFKNARALADMLN